MMNGGVRSTRYQAGIDVDECGEPMAWPRVRRSGREGRQRPRQLQQVVRRLSLLLRSEGKPVCLLCKYLGKEIRGGTEPERRKGRLENWL